MEILEEVREEAKYLRNYVNPTNLQSLFASDIKPFNRRACLHSGCFRSSSGETMRRFMLNACRIVIENPFLSNKSTINCKKYTLALDQEWVWLSTVGSFRRIYKYLTPLEFYLIINPDKIGKILDYIKNIDDELLL